MPFQDFKCLPFWCLFFSFSGPKAKCFADDVGAITFVSNHGQRTLDSSIGGFGHIHAATGVGFDGIVYDDSSLRICVVGHFAFFRVVYCFHEEVLSFACKMRTKV